MRTYNRKTSKQSALFLMICAFLFSVHTFAQKTIELTGSDKMKFDKEQITVKPGEEVTIKLTTDSKLPAQAMSHNFVLLKQSSDDKAFAMSSAKYKNNDYIDPDKSNEVIAHTDMAAGGETVEVSFTAPKQTGDYDYICTFPGHYVSGMKGILTVK